MHVSILRTDTNGPRSGSVPMAKFGARSDLVFRAGVSIGAECSVNQSSLETVKQYITKQEEHHRKLSFQDEIRAPLRRHETEGTSGMCGAEPPRPLPRPNPFGIQRAKSDRGRYWLMMRQKLCGFTSVGMLNEPLKATLIVARGR